MNYEAAESLIHKAVVDVANVPFGNRDLLRQRLLHTVMIIEKVFGPNSHYFKELSDMPFSGEVFCKKVAGEDFKSSWDKGMKDFVALGKAMMDDVRVSRELEQDSQSVKREQKPAPSYSSKVFIVHGHDEEMKLAVARTLELLRLTPIILHEQSDNGMTVVEKLIKHSDVGFAVVVLSPDDIGYAKSDEPDHAKSRARQNVVLELGLFIGKLGRERVVALHKESHDFEMPSDFKGVIYKAYDSKGSWRFELFKELKAVGYSIDANNLI